MEVLWRYIGTILSKLKFIVIVNPFENAVQIRMGKYLRTLVPGYHYVRPFGIDNVLAENVTVDTREMGTQSLTTRDDVQVQLEVVITYHVFNVRRFILDATDADSALTDTATGYVSEAVGYSTWEEVRKPSFTRLLKKHIQKEARKWGIAVTKVKFISLVACPTVRILLD